MNTAISTTPYHNCIQVALENDYFKGKLKQFYVENKSLKEKLSQLENQLKEKQNEAIVDNKSIKNDVNSNKNKEIFKSKIPIRLSKSPVVQTTSNLIGKNNNSNHNKIESTTTRCTVCSNNANRIKLENATIANCNCGCNTKQFDSDIYNQQNKVNPFIFLLLTY
jgi:cell division septum initiation protein DivIVA